MEIIKTTHKSLTNKVKHNKELDLASFFKKSKHFFIMNDAGKPIYSRYGNEMENCGFIATFSAIMSKFTHFNSINKEAEKLHYISTDKINCVFVKKNRLVFIALSKKKEPLSLLSTALEYLYIQLISVITSERIARLEDNPSYCFTALSGTEELFESIIQYSTKTLTSVLNSFPVLQLDSLYRSRLYNILNSNKGKALLSLILTPYDVSTIVKSENIELMPSDIALIQNIIFASESLRQTESWVPICLPGISDMGYLQIYCNFFEINLGIVFITESQDQNMFLEFADQSRNIYDAVCRENLNVAINNAVETKLSYSKKTIKSITEDEQKKLIDEFNSKLAFFTLKPKDGIVNPFETCKYLLCKNKALNQYFTHKFDNFDSSNQEENEIIKIYCKLYDMYVSSNTQNGFFHYEKENKYCHTIHTTDNHIIFGSFNTFSEFDDIRNVMASIIKTLKSKESNFYIAIK